MEKPLLPMMFVVFPRNQSTHLGSEYSPTPATSSADVVHMYIAQSSPQEEGVSGRSESCCLA